MHSEQIDEKWNFCPQPFECESFLSWFTRLAKENCSDVDLLYQKLRTLSSLRSMNKQIIEKQLTKLESNKKLKNELIENLSPFVEINPSRLKKISFNTSEINNQWDYLNVPLQTPRYCPLSLKDDETPHFRYYWFLKFFTYCNIHKILLKESCPHCYSPIKLWKTNWDQSVDSCFYCKEDLKRGVISLSKVNADFQEKFVEIFNARIYNGNNDSIYFFRQIWKITTVESKDPKIKKIELNSEPLSTERIFKALLITNKCLEKDKERFNKPFLCLKDGLKFSNKFELDLHKKQNYTLESIKDEEIRRKFEIIDPLLEMGKLTHNVIDRRGKQFGVNRYTIYRWIRAFKQNGIDGLARNKCEKGKRSKRFSNEVYQIIEDKINAYDGQSLSMKKCWEDIKNDCIALGYEVSQIPTYEAIRKRIKQI